MLAPKDCGISARPVAKVAVLFINWRRSAEIIFEVIVLKDEFTI